MNAPHAAAVSAVVLYVDILLKFVLKTCLFYCSFSARPIRKTDFSPIFQRSTRRAARNNREFFFSCWDTRGDSIQAREALTNRN
jgi:hypothetical protein